MNHTFVMSLPAVVQGPADRGSHPYVGFHQGPFKGVGEAA